MFDESLELSDPILSLASAQWRVAGVGDSVSSPCDARCQEGFSLSLSCRILLLPARIIRSFANYPTVELITWLMSDRMCARQPRQSDPSATGSPPANRALTANYN